MDPLTLLTIAIVNIVGALTDGWRSPMDPFAHSCGNKTAQIFQTSSSSAVNLPKWILVTGLPMTTRNWIDLKQDAASVIETVRAHFEGHAYDPNWHDAYLVGVTEQGRSEENTTEIQSLMRIT